MRDYAPVLVTVKTVEMPEEKVSRGRPKGRISHTWALLLRGKLKPGRAPASASSIGNNYMVKVDETN